jgi:uncharacterized protein with HEPN domain
MADEKATVLDIVLACRRVLRFIAGVDEPTFLANEEKHWAVASQLLIIGEAVRRLSDDFRSRFPQIPWPQVAGMRNRLIHQYDQINWALVWKTADEDVPALLAELEPLTQSPDDADAAEGDS